MSKNDIPSHRFNGQIQQSLYDTPDSPLKDALKCITRQEPPDYVKGYDYRDLTDDEAMTLQEWASDAVVEAGYEWMTGIGTIEAAIHMVKCAEENGNIGTNPRDSLPKAQPDTKEEVIAFLQGLVSGDDFIQDQGSSIRLSFNAERRSHTLEVIAFRLEKNPISDQWEVSVGTSACIPSRGGLEALRAYRRSLDVINHILEAGIVDDI